MATCVHHWQWRHVVKVDAIFESLDFIGFVSLWVLYSSNFPVFQHEPIRFQYTLSLPSESIRKP